MESRVPKEVVEFIKAEAEKHKYQVVDITTKGGGTFHLEVTLDKEGGITLNECGDFNRKLMEWLDANQMFLRGYVVDVCSPGLDRELKSDTEYAWAEGKRVKVSLREPVDGKGEIVGKLVKAGDDLVIEDEKGRSVTIKKKNLIRARLHVALRK